MNDWQTAPKGLDVAALRQAHKYCSGCGKPMVLVENHNRPTYDRATGEEQPVKGWKTWECPNYESDRPTISDEFNRHDRVYP